MKKLITVDGNEACARTAYPFPLNNHLIDFFFFTFLS